MSTIYLYSKRDVANIVRTMTEDLLENSKTQDWYTETGASVLAQALEIWLDRLNNYDQWSQSIREDAVRCGATLREGG